jgi:hypothetical protein
MEFAFYRDSLFSSLKGGGKGRMLFSLTKRKHSLHYNPRQEKGQAAKSGPEITQTRLLPRQACFQQIYSTSGKEDTASWATRFILWTKRYGMHSRVYGASP